MYITSLVMTCHTRSCARDLCATVVVWPIRHSNERNTGLFEVVRTTLVDRRVAPTLSFTHETERQGTIETTTLEKVQRQLCGDAALPQKKTGQGSKHFEKIVDWVRTTKLDSRKVESDQGGLMSYGTCHTLPPVFLSSSWFFLDHPDPL